MTERKLNYLQEAVVDLVLQVPNVTQKELSEIFGLSTNSVSALVRSDLFMDRLAQRKQTLIDPHIMRTMNDRMHSVSMLAMAAIEKQLIEKPNAAYAMKVLAMLGKNGQANDTEVSMPTMRVNKRKPMAKPHMKIDAPENDE